MNKNLPNVPLETIFWKPSIIILLHSLPSIYTPNQDVLNPTYQAVVDYTRQCSQETLLSLATFSDLISRLILSLIYISNKKTV